MLRRGGALIGLGLATLSVAVAIGILLSRELSVGIFLLLTCVIVSFVVSCIGIFTLLRFMADKSIRLSKLEYRTEAVERISQTLVGENVEFRKLTRELRAENTVLADKIVRSKSN